MFHKIIQFCFLRQSTMFSGFCFRPLMYQGQGGQKSQCLRTLFFLNKICSLPMGGPNWRNNFFSSYLSRLLFVEFVVLTTPPLISIVCLMYLIKTYAHRENFPFMMQHTRECLLILYFSFDCIIVCLLNPFSSILFFPYLLLFFCLSCL